jgi:transcriptional regulator with XRE-family HTH domain
MTITVSQLRAARGLLGWSQEKLAEESGVGRATIADFEAGKRAPYDRTLEQLRAALEAAGVEFTNGGQPGVRTRKDPAYGYLYDDERLVGTIKDGELRADSPGRKLVALVKDQRLHDPETGEFICGLAEIGPRGKPLPSRLKARFK